MRPEFKEEAAVLVERLARIAAAADSVCVAQRSAVLMAQLWTLVTAAAADLRKYAGRETL